MLFNKDNKGICVINLDSVMPSFYQRCWGYDPHPYPPADEEEANFEKIVFRNDFIKQLLKDTTMK